MALAGFSAGEAEGLRRAMSRKRSDAALRGYRGRFVEGAVAEGVEREVAERVFDQIKGFSGFGFPKSHAAAFGLLAYQSTWLRVHYGPEFLCALLNEQPMGFYPPDALVHEAQRRGIEVRAVEVNESAVECRVEPDASPPTPASERDAADPGLSVRIGLGFVKGLAAADAEAVVSERDLHGPYADLADLASRSGVSRDGLERLAWSGACAAIGTEPGEAGRPGEAGDPRRVPLWRLGVARGSQRTRDGEQLALPLPVLLRPPSPSRRPGSGSPPTTPRAASRSPSTRWSCCARPPRGHGHLRRSRAHRRRQLAARGRSARRPPASGDRARGDVPADRG